MQKGYNEVLINPYDSKRVISTCQSVFIIANSSRKVKDVLQSKAIATESYPRRASNGEGDVDDDDDDAKTSNGASSTTQLYSSDMDGDLSGSPVIVDSKEMLSGRIESLFNSGSKPNMKEFKGFRGFTAGLCSFNVKSHFFLRQSDVKEFDQHVAINSCASTHVDAKQANDETEYFISDEEDDVTRFIGHIVIVLIEHEDQKLDAAILDVVYCLMSIRKYFNGKVLVLSERGDEMSERATEIADMNRIKLDSLFFFHGNPRNQSHLRACFVHLARSIVLLRSDVDTQSVNRHVLFPEKNPSHLNQSPEQFRQYNDQVRNLLFIH